MTRFYRLCVVTVLTMLLFATLLTRGCSSKLSVGVKMLAGQSAAAPSLVYLSATNQTSQDYAFSCCLEVQTKSGWSDAESSEDIRTLRYFRKGQIVQMEVGLPSKTGVYRFHCFYEPLKGTTWTTKMHDKLLTIRFPGSLGVRYREFVARLQPWPKSFYSDVFVVKTKVQATRSKR